MVLSAIVFLSYSFLSLSLVSPTLFTHLRTLSFSFFLLTSQVPPFTCVSLFVSLSFLFTLLCSLFSHSCPRVLSLLLFRSCLSFSSLSLCAETSPISIVHQAEESKQQHMVPSFGCIFSLCLSLFLIYSLLIVFLRRFCPRVLNVLLSFLSLSIQKHHPRLIIITFTCASMFVSLSFSLILLSFLFIPLSSSLRPSSPSCPHDFSLPSCICFLFSLSLYLCRNLIHFSTSSTLFTNPKTTVPSQTHKQTPSRPQTQQEALQTQEAAEQNCHCCVQPIRRRGDVRGVPAPITVRIALRNIRETVRDTRAGRLFAGERYA